MSAARPEPRRSDHGALSRALRAQAPSALRELLVGFQHADRLAGGALLGGREDALTGALVVVVLRAVFLFLADARDLCPRPGHGDAPSDSLTQIHADLRRDALAERPALDDRHAAWPRLLTLFRRMHGDGAGPQRACPSGGDLFDPDAHPVLEGRAQGDRGPLPSPPDLPRIPDGALLRALDWLRTLDGVVIDPRDLDAEHLGAAYEGLLGFRICVAKGPCVALQPDDVVIDLDDLAALGPADRLAHLADEAGLWLRGKLAAAVRSASDVGALGRALARRASPRAPEPIPPGALYLQVGEARRRAGAHYTSPSMTREMVQRTLAPLLCDAMTPHDLLSLKICDPAMGSGAFLVAACRYLGDHLAAAIDRELAPPPGPEALADHARALVAAHCLYGVDRDPLAAALARLSLWIETADRGRPLSFLDHALRHGDALVGLSPAQIAAASVAPASVAPATRPRAPRPLPRAARAAGDAVLAAFFEGGGRRGRARAMAGVRELVGRLLDGAGPPDVEERLAAFRARRAPFHWEIELPEVFAPERGGFDAMIGNPPWVSYVGRAAQPLEKALRDYYAAANPAFGGYKNLQALFVHRAASLLRPGGRLGLVLPTSMSDLKGYAPARRAHDALCVCDDALPDFGNHAFEGVFQPCMGLLSTRRAAGEAAGPKTGAEAGAWPLERRDLDAAAAALLDKLGALPRLPPHLFGERGFQTMGDDVKRLRALAGPADDCTLPMRTGSDIGPFLRRPAGLYCDPRAFDRRLRPLPDWQAVKLLIRQTARYPMAALSDGLPFRNSILAGFYDAAHSAHFLLAYLNSTPIRWYHYMRHRDARQGMPQLKIAHLRALPAPPPDAPPRAALEGLGRALGERNAGVSPAEQDEIDALVADALGLDDAERARVAAWGAAAGA